MQLTAALIYWVIVALWATVLIAILSFYIRSPRAFATARLLLAVLAIDTARNLIENIYFGVYFGSKYGLFPATAADVLGMPHLLILPKVVNVIAGGVVLFLLLRRWLPTFYRDAIALQLSADTDSLTGLLNRRALLAFGREALAHTLRSGSPLAVLMIDIDHFKAANDAYRHGTGDKVLERVASAIQLSLRPADRVGRFGGEEFLVLLENANADRAFMVAERIRLAVAATRVSSAHSNIQVTVSIGWSLAHAADKTLEQVIERADRALYAAKSQGRNQCCHKEAHPSAAPHILLSATQS